MRVNSYYGLNSQAGFTLAECTVNHGLDRGEGLPKLRGTLFLAGY